MSINVPEIYEETHQIESNSDTISVPLNGIPKVMESGKVQILQDHIS